MRMFIAADLPEPVLVALAETSARLREVVHGRFVSPDSFHITLAFLGDVRTGDVARAADALERACAGRAPLPVSLGDFGTFGKRSKATLWQGLAHGDELMELAEQVRGCLRVNDIPFDDKKFLPHVTLMRAADLTAGVLPAPMRAHGRVTRVCLYRSDLSGPHPVYEAWESVELSV